MSEGDPALKSEAPGAVSESDSFDPSVSGNVKFLGGAFDAGYMMNALGVLSKEKSVFPKGQDIVAPVISDPETSPQE